MLSPSWTTGLLLLSVARLALAETLPTLENALVVSGASDFWDVIKSDPELLQLYSSGLVKTVFAPLDSKVDGSGPPQKRALSPKQRREARLQAAKKETEVGEASQSHPGTTVETNDNPPQLDGAGQKVVIDTNGTQSGSNTKRWYRRSSSSSSSSIVDRAANCCNTTYPSLLRISAGLGKITNVIKGDIKYQGGVLHITDGYFTFPESLSASAKGTGQTTFADLVSKNNLTDTLDAAHSITAFLPSNDAFAAINTTTSASAALLANHVVSGVSYLPDLTDGCTLKSQRGDTLSVTVKNGQWYVNGARITQANVILENGVAHIIDKVLTPAKPPPVTAGAGSSMSQTLSLGTVAAAVGGGALLALLALV
ncbi:FAS1 domain-containing protein [Podospora didyma]|uniref:FAS1 domain-containing protein n=1 Tax=Podospora didyma TaxID=330526 RepID=A0AAE0KE00_9PEZI|nr:FAS1 domain-containing protein [Podospora didyma]